MLWFLCTALFITLVVLFIKILLLKKSIDEIRIDIVEHLSAETNTLISSSSFDRHIRHLVSELNTQLRLLRKHRQKYLNGSLELTEAVTNISHDIRTPLTAIWGYLDLLKQEETSPAVEKYINIIENRVEMIKYLTDELFRYSILTTSKKDKVNEKIFLNEILEESIAEFYVVLKERCIVPSIKMPENKISRCLNRSALSRVLSNLLNNALKYSDGDLIIVLSDTGKITFCNTASNLNVTQVKNLFDRFYTVQSASKSTGLGLSISRTLIEQMHGTISAEYKDNKLYVCIFLPDD